MQTSRFFATVGDLFDGDPQHHDPTDPRWVELSGDVDGFTSPNELAVLNHAAALLPADEAYLEVGTFKGRSLVGAVQDNPGKTYVAIENFLEFGMAGEQARAELQRNLAAHAAHAAPELIEGDCFEVMARPGAIDRPVGVYFYDGEHTLLAHYLALAVVEPLLADEALILVDDATWPVVQRAHRLFLKRHPGWQICERWDAVRDDDPRWANGMHALVFRRTGGARGLSRVDEALRRYQVTGQNRVNRLAWKLGSRFPGVAKKAEALLVGRARAVRRDEV